MMSVTAPQQPMATPPAFFHVMGSWRIRNDSNMAKMGMEVVTILALTGEVMLSPMVKQHWLHTSPKTAAPAKVSLSRKGTCSLGRKKDVIQKSSAPPATLNDTMSMPSSP